MMDMLDIYKHARNSLISIQNRQLEILTRNMNNHKMLPELRARYKDTEAKLQWIEKVIKAWEV